MILFWKDNDCVNGKGEYWSYGWPKIFGFKVEKRSEIFILGSVEKQASGDISATWCYVASCKTLSNLINHCVTLKCVQFYPKHMNMNLTTFYFGSCRYRGNLKMKCLVSGNKRLIAFENFPPTLNPTIKLTDSVKKRKREIKTHILRQYKYLSSFIRTYVFHFYPNAPHCTCSAVPGEVLSKFTGSGNP